MPSKEPCAGSMYKTLPPAWIMRLACWMGVLLRDPAEGENCWGGAARAAPAKSVKTRTELFMEAIVALSTAFLLSGCFDFLQSDDRGRIPGANRTGELLLHAVFVILDELPGEAGTLFGIQAQHAEFDEFVRNDL